ncbi:MAG: hypothetical protein EHM35_15860 [Planctomycetaceae bacterium]|nr:MAG: hypothetical protein EHM35_15860 [Planctomycetaceae bacterium]
MAIEEVVTTILRCDVCGVKEDPCRSSVVVINGHGWDACPTCAPDLLRMLNFLTGKVGLPIEFGAVGTPEGREAATQRRLDALQTMPYLEQLRPISAATTNWHGRLATEMEQASEVLLAVSDEVVL